ncbi:unnamed protein product [Bemisia tabaci]|uniref:Uncharacterized protein n=1 Tax=Bemisia tabaci TaxID=7038 RepID=A0A9P0ADV7_BEMTA|nr:unnamed protein product [Bemisia tabaci]
MSRLSQFYRPAAAQPPCSSLEQNQFATCLFCDERFTLPSEEGNILKHLFVTHHFIIAEGHVISNLKKERKKFCASVFKLGLNLIASW